MTGARLEAKLDDAQVQGAVRRLLALGQTMLPVARAIGVGLVRNTQDRFREARDPQGQAWRTLNPAYAVLKRGPGILRESAMRGGLMGSISFQAAGGFSGAAVMVGTNKVYGAVHQFGAVIRPKSAGGRLYFRDGRGNVWGAARSVTLPARPYLGISREDRQTIADVLDVAVQRAVRG
jgi:phage virion morphogenesis protein